MTSLADYSAPRVDAPVRETLTGTALRPGWVGLAAVLLIGVAGVADTLPPSLLYAPLVASALVLGIPHGAVDHLTPARALGRPTNPRSLAAVGGLYLLLGGAYAVAWVFAPAAAFVFFILLTWAHWGQGDVYPLVAWFEETHLPDRSDRLLAAFVRGGLPMAVPLVGAPTQYHDVATRVVGLFDSGAAGSLLWLLDPRVRLAVGVGFAAVTAFALARGYRRCRSWRVDAVETVLLWLYFLVVPPVLAVGLYFPLWHSLRHVGRLVSLDAASQRALAAGDGVAALGRFARDAAPLTLVSVALLGAVAAAVPAGVGSVPDVGAAYLVLLAVLTLPHVVVVTWLDRVQDVW
jgi:Brp/Blh family beta-carotene 15,15'-monooxygenase